jgi:hypothetical protein
MCTENESASIKILFVVSIVFNAFLLLFFIFALTRNVAAVSFLNIETGSTRYLHSAFIVSVPQENADIIFGPLEFSLKKGSEASLQFAFLLDGRQLNTALEPLYDHSIVSIEPSPYGIIIRGISSGETVLQLFAYSGFRDIARIIVYE